VGEEYWRHVNLEEDRQRADEEELRRCRLLPRGLAHAPPLLPHSLARWWRMASLDEDGGTEDGGALFLAAVPWSLRATSLAAVLCPPRLFATKVTLGKAEWARRWCSALSERRSSIEEIFLSSIGEERHPYRIR
jgi:hypothetical protein